MKDYICLLFIFGAYLLPAQNVGIGTTNPKTDFHVGANGKVLFGADTEGTGYKFMFLPDLGAFRVGFINSGSSSTYWDQDSIGAYSFASGFNTRARGYGTTAMGRNTRATNNYAFATGHYTHAYGQYSTAMGRQSEALGRGSTALGTYSEAEGDYSFAMGFYPKAEGIYSIAAGDNVIAKSYSSMAVGIYNVGLGSSNAWVDTDPIFEVGIGTSESTRANAMLIRKNGNVGIGTNYPNETLHVLGKVRIGSYENINDGGNYMLDFEASLRPEVDGYYSLGNSAKRWSILHVINGVANTSDLRQKENIESMEYGIQDLMKLRPVKYTWKAYPEQGPKLGLIAQEVKQVIEEVVLDKGWITSEETGEKTEVDAEKMGIYYSDLIPVLIKSIQEQQAIITDLKQRIEVLEQE